MCTTDKHLSTVNLLENIQNRATQKQSVGQPISQSVTSHNNENVVTVAINCKGLISSCVMTGLWK